MKMISLSQELENNSYPGRGIAVGKDCVYYFIMGRSENSRNRVFTEKDGAVYTEPFDVTYDAKNNEYVVEGPRIEKMLGYTNLDTEKGMNFFQKYLKDEGKIVGMMYNVIGKESVYLFYFFSSFSKRKSSLLNRSSEQILFFINF